MRAQGDLSPPSHTLHEAVRCVASPVPEHVVNQSSSFGTRNALFGAMRTDVHHGSERPSTVGPLDSGTSS